jgi:hypothetical protein
MLDEKKPPLVEGGGLSETSRQNKQIKYQYTAAPEFDGEIALALTASGWRVAAGLLTLAAKCIEAGDFLNAERNRQRAREQFLAANEVFRQFQEARAAASAWIGAEAFRDVEPIDRGRRAAEVARISVLPIDSATRP